MCLVIANYHELEARVRRDSEVARREEEVSTRRKYLNAYLREATKKLFLVVRPLGPLAPLFFFVLE